MNKKFSALLLLIIIMVAVFASACTDSESGGIKSDTVISVAENTVYDESKWVGYLAEEKDICLAADGVSDYKIIIPYSDADAFREDAEYLCDVLRKMTGSEAFEVISDAEFYAGKYISLGNTSYAKDISGSAAENDGYVIKSEGGNIFIKSSQTVSADTAVDGVINGIYGFAEDILGCMFVRDDYDYIPYAPTVYLDDIDLVSNPDFVWRRIYQYEVSQNDWSKRIKSNGTGEKSDIGNDGNKYWGTWCHSVFKFVDPELYFESHPEYYALIDGNRRIEYNGNTTQLCFTNSDIYPIIEAKLAEFIAEYPDAKYWDFSINDNNFYCQCDECEKSYEKYGSRAGALIEILNKLAKKFPDKYISTLAYMYTKDVPEGIVCEKNVNIVIAPIETSQLYSSKYGDNEASAEAKKMIEDWSAVCDNLFVWDYVVDFKNLLMPYPNFAVQKDNAEFYKENNVRSVFHQGSREKGDELACMRSYLLAKQLWNTDTDVNALLGKYMAVTYGGAADYIAEYIDIMHESVRNEATELDLYDAPSAHHGDYLSSEKIQKYLQLTQKALDAVSGDSERTGYVEEIRINVLYANMYREGWNIFEKEEAFEEFRALVVKHGIERPYEVAPPDMDEFLNETYPLHLASIKLYISLCVIGGVAVAAGAIFLAFYIVKKKSKKA